MTTFRLGCKRDVSDARDLQFASLGFGVEVPESASLRQHVLDIYDQQQTSSCVANAWSQAMRMSDSIEGAASPAPASRLFVYYGARKYDGGPIEDGGTQLRSAAKAIVKFGRPPESAWPFDEAKVNNQPSWEAFREAFDHAGPAGYFRVSGIDQIKQALAAGKPVVGGVEVGNSIFGYSSGIYSPSASEAKIGGHALVFAGYDADSFTLVNSWGAGYGESGFMRVSYDFAAAFSDCWAVHT